MCYENQLAKYGIPILALTLLATATVPKSILTASVILVPDGNQQIYFFVATVRLLLNRHNKTIYRENFI